MFTNDTRQLLRPLDLAALLILSSFPVYGATITVDSALDGAPNDGDGNLTLREALLIANDSSGATSFEGISSTDVQDTIVFNNALSGQIIQLTEGELPVNQDVEIQGLGADQLTVSGESTSRVFNFGGGTYVVSGLDIANGFTAGFGGAITASPNHHLTLLACVVRDSRSDLVAGGINANRGTLHMVDSTLANNSASLQSGGINFEGTNDSKIINTTISGNSTDGGGIGGGGFGNLAFNGQTALLTLINVTMAGNTSNNGASFRTTTNAGAVSATTQYQNCIFASPSGSNIFAAQAGGPSTNLSLGHNISSNGDGNLIGAGDQPNTDPVLGPLQNNGGPTPTHALLERSPAIDFGNNALAVDLNNAPLSFDQRGTPFDRVTDGNFDLTATVDIGAFEVDNFAPVIEDQPFAVTENSGDGTVVGTVFARDIDPGQSLSYHIIGGNGSGGGAFAIDISTGQITVNDSAQLDSRTTPFFSLIIEVQDNGTRQLVDTATITITLKRFRIDSGQSEPDGSLTIGFRGTAGLPYRIQSTTSLTPAVWTDLATVVANPDGSLSVVVPSPVPRIMFFRSVDPVTP